MRINCMDIFHYVADQLRHEPLFDNSTTRTNEGMGAIYNDFDFDPINFLNDAADEEFTYSQTSNLVARYVVNTREVVPSVAVDYAIIQADDREGILYDDLTFDHPLHDIESDINTLVYLQKLYTIISSEWRNICPLITSNTLKAYERRKAVNWKGSDTFYDMWLMATHSIRECFPVDKFKKIYPNFWDFLEVDSDGSDSSDSESSDSETDESAAESEDDESDIDLFQPVGDSADYSFDHDNSVSLPVKLEEEEAFIPTIIVQEAIEISSSDEEDMQTVVKIENLYVPTFSSHVTINLISDEE